MSDIPEIGIGLAPCLSAVCSVGLEGQRAAGRGGLGATCRFFCRCRLYLIAKNIMPPRTNAPAALVPIITCIDGENDDEGGLI